MEYLLSLLGKDQETITEDIKELAANAEKVKSQSNEIDKLFGDIDESKEEINYLHNKLESKRNLVDDLECELEKKDDQIYKLNDSIQEILKT